MDFGSWVIVASLMLPNGQQVQVNPSTLFDEAACRKQAMSINEEWHQAKVVGIATCRQVGTNDRP